MIRTTFHRPPRTKTAVVFADDYRELQQKISKMSGDPLPPCYFCSAHQLWRCHETGEECDTFRRYSS